MTRAVIVGSGPGAAGVALALSHDPTVEITVLDIGHQLEADRKAVLDDMHGQTPSEWSREEINAISAQPTGETTKGLPQKRSYGSDYPFKDVGQLQAVRAIGHANASVVSGAYGGLSNVWGSQIMPFSSEVFSQWPVSLTEMEPHYRAILDEIPFAGEDDALSRRHPLISTPSPLPPLAPRTNAVLSAFDAHAAALEELGVTVGRARLAFESNECVRCGMCMTGCPYSLIYSASQTFDRLRSEQRVTYRDNLLVVEVGQSDATPFVIARDLSTGEHHRFEADRIFLACGAVGTTRLVMGSLGIYDQDVDFAESVQFALPMLSKQPVADPRKTTEFTLNQFNMLIATDEEWMDVSQIHFYPHNDSVVENLPAILQRPSAEPILSQLLKRLTIGLGYLPSWESPTMRVKITKPDLGGDLPGIVVSGDEWGPLSSRMFQKVARKLVQVAPKLDLWPIFPQAIFSAPGKSYHFGGSFPHRTRPVDGSLTTDRLGRLDGWSNVHLVDASVFPTVPATTFTLTIMANAHRIATETRALP